MFTVLLTMVLFDLVVGALKPAIQAVRLTIKRTIAYEHKKSITMHC